jgi:ribonuclease P protein component
MTSLRGNQKFPKADRIRSPVDFAAVYEQGLRIGDACMSLVALANEESQTRLGLAVSKRCGNAVRRNRLKRRLREAFRLSRADLPPGLDLVIQPRADTPLQLVALRQSLISLTKRAAKKWAVLPRTSRAEASTSEETQGAS